MPSIKKIFVAISIFSAVLLFSGCGLNNPQTGSNGENPQPEAKTIKESDNYVKELPSPTGNPDDAVSAALNEAESENSDVALEEQEAITSIDDSNETYNLKNSYEENEF